jgi:hypothetical protein
MKDNTEEIIEVGSNIPFEENDGGSFINSFIKTMVMLIASPVIFFGRMHINKGIKKPLLFLLLMVAVANILGYVYVSAGIMPSASENIAQMVENNPELAQRSGLLRFMVSEEPKLTDIIFGTAVNFLVFYLLAFYWHFVLSSLRIALNGREATIRIFCYSSVVLCASVIPLSNPYINMAAYLWWSFLVYTGISEAHEVSKRLALRGLSIGLFATLIPFLLLTIAFI